MPYPALLATLQAELDFLETGGYGESAGRWHAPLIFEDGPHCLAARGEPLACHRCPLSSCVPVEHRSQPAACRHIVLTADGQSLESLYRTATQRRLEEAVHGWLIRQILDLRRSGAETLDSWRCVDGAKGGSVTAVTARLPWAC